VGNFLIYVDNTDKTWYLTLKIKLILKN